MSKDEGFSFAEHHRIKEKDKLDAFRRHIRIVRASKSGKENAQQ